MKATLSLPLLGRITGDYVTGTDIVICCWREYCDMPPNVLVHSHIATALSMAAPLIESYCQAPVLRLLFQVVSRVGHAPFRVCLWPFAVSRVSNLSVRYVS